MPESGVFGSAWGCSVTGIPIANLGRFLPFQRSSPDQQLLNVKLTIDKNTWLPKSDRQLLRMKLSVNESVRGCHSRQKTAMTGFSHIRS